MARRAIFHWVFQCSTLVWIGLAARSFYGVFLPVFTHLYTKHVNAYMMDKGVI